MELDGIPLAQMPEQIELLDNTIQEFDVSTFIELGLYKGGLANYMLQKQNKDFFHYFGFELHPNDLHPKVRNRPEIMAVDAHAPSTVAYVQGVINTTRGHVLVFGDTFNKPMDMELYAPILRIGDLVMGHDYPGEVSYAFLVKFGREHPYLEEVRPDEYKGHGVSLWRRVE